MDDKWCGDESMFKLYADYDRLYFDKQSRIYSALKDSILKKFKNGNPYP